LGIDPDAEPHLLDLAREGLMAALPKGWSPCFHEASGAWYYYQASTGTTTWEHPLDAVYRGLVEQARAGNKRQLSLGILHNIILYVCFMNNLFELNYDSKLYLFIFLYLKHNFTFIVLSFLNCDVLTDNR